MRATVAAITAGAVCRLGQYLSNQSFWGDEAYLVLNVRSKTPSELIGSLTMTVAGHSVPPQTAPPSYVLALKGLSALMGQTEYAYRLPALLMGLAALPLMAWLAWRILPLPAAVAVACLAMSDRLIDHAVVVKQYSGDVAVAIVLMGLAIGAGKPQRRLAITGCVAAVALWYSAPVVFVFAGIGLALLPEVWRQKNGWLAWLACCVPAAVSFCFLYEVSLHHQQDPRLYLFWAEHFPDYARPLRWPWWLIKELYGLFAYPYPWGGWLMLPLAVLGAIHFRRRAMSQTTAILTLPILLALIAAVLHQYPFGGSRVTVFLLPGIFLLAAAGLGELQTERALLAAGLLLVEGIIVAAYQLVVPRCTSHLRPAVDWVETHRQPDDTIILIGDNTWPVFFTYWPNPPGRILIDDVSTPVHGRFWCVCEYAPGQYARKRKPEIDLASQGSEPIHSSDYVGRGGAAFLFVRP